MFHNKKYIDFKFTGRICFLYSILLIASAFIPITETIISITLLPIIFLRFKRLLNDECNYYHANKIISFYVIFILLGFAIGFSAIFLVFDIPKKTTFLLIDISSIFRIIAGICSIMLGIYLLKLKTNINGIIKLLVFLFIFRGISYSLAYTFPTTLGHKLMLNVHNIIPIIRISLVSNVFLEIITFALMGRVFIKLSQHSLLNNQEEISNI